MCSPPAHNVATDNPKFPESDQDLWSWCFIRPPTEIERDAAKSPCGVIAPMPNEDLAVLIADFPDAPPPLRLCPKGKLPRKEKGFTAMTFGNARPKILRSFNSMKSRA